MNHEMDIFVLGPHGSWRKILKWYAWEIQVQSINLFMRSWVWFFMAYPTFLNLFFTEILDFHTLLADLCYRALGGSIQLRPGSLEMTCSSCADLPDTLFRLGYQLAGCGDADYRLCSEYSLSEYLYIENQECQPNFLDLYYLKPLSVHTDLLLISVKFPCSWIEQLMSSVFL